MTPIGPGTLLAGRFELQDLLDEFQGAKLWRATDTILARDVAVHVVADDDPRADALLSAARTSANVTDGHLLRVLDAACEDGVAYVVNEWGSGISLDRLLTEGPLSPRRAAWVAKEVAEAISAAHRHGIAHGRLLPENVMVTEAGSVKLIGFVVDAVLRGRQRFRVTGGDSLGEHEADVVNLASLLYAGLVAKWPGTEGSTLPDAPAEHGSPLRPRQVRAGVPRPLDAICERVLNPDAHPQVTPIETAHEVYAALCDFIGDPAASPGHVEEALLGGDEPTTATGAVGTAAGAAAAAGSDETQAGTPVFYDEDTGVGWVASTPGAAPAGNDPDGTQAASPPRPPSPPPPPLPEPEPKPLFASEEPRPSRRDRSEPTPRSFGAGNGPLPVAWGPDADEPPPVDPTGEWGTNNWDNEPPGRSWLRLAGAIAGVLIVVVAIVFAFNLGREAGDTGEVPGETTAAGESTQPSPSPVSVASVTDFDPTGDGAENPQTAPLAIDGKPNTAWRTSTYFDALPLQKEGVGLLVDLGKAVKVTEVEVGLIGTPTSLQLLAASERGSAPASLDDVRPVATVEDAGTTATLTPRDPVTTRYLVVWLTDLPAVGGDFRGQVAEIVVRS